MAREDSRLRERRGHERLRAEGGGPDHQLVFTDRVIVTLVIPRFQLPHAALALFYGVDRSTVTRAVHEIRPLLAACGFAVPGETGVRPHTLADVFAYAAAKGVEPRLDGTEVRVRRPQAGRPGRRAFVSGKMRRNTKKATVVTDERGRTLWTGAIRPGRMHDQTAVKTEGIEDLFEQYPQVKAKVDAGYRGLAKQFPDQVQAPPKKPGKDAPPEEFAAWEEARLTASGNRASDIWHTVADPDRCPVARCAGTLRAMGPGLWSPQAARLDRSLRPVGATALALPPADRLAGDGQLPVDGIGVHLVRPRCRQFGQDLRQRRVVDRGDGEDGRLRAPAGGAGRRSVRAEDGQRGKDRRLRWCRNIAYRRFP